MNQSITLGQSVRQAVEFLRGIHRDVHKMVMTLDEQMDRKGCRPPKSSRVSDDLSNGLGIDRWLIESVYRIYSPVAISDRFHKIDTIAAIEVEFLSPDAYDEPVCLLLAVRFRQPRPYADMWDNWEKSDRALTLLTDTRGMQRLPPDVLHDGMFPHAAAGSAGVVRLCELADVDLLKSKVVQPLLDAYEALQNAAC